MEQLKVHIRYVMLWGLKITQTLQKQQKITLVFITKVSLLTDKFEPGPGRSLDLDQDALRELVEGNPRKSTKESVLDRNTFQSISTEKCSFNEDK